MDRICILIVPNSIRLACKCAGEQLACMFARNWKGLDATKKITVGSRM